MFNTYIHIILTVYLYTLLLLTLQLIYSWVPTRSQLIGKGEAHAENLQVLEKFLPTMREYLNRIDLLLKKYNLDVPKA